MDKDNGKKERLRYSNISIPDKLARYIDTYNKEHPDLDLRSRAATVVFALRKLFTDSEDAGSG